MICKFEMPLVGLSRDSAFTDVAVFSPPNYNVATTHRRRSVTSHTFPKITLDVIGPKLWSRWDFSNITRWAHTQPRPQTSILNIDTEITTSKILGYMTIFLRCTVCITVHHLANNLSAKRQQMKEKPVKLTSTGLFFNADNDKTLHL